METKDLSLQAAIKAQQKTIKALKKQGVTHELVALRLKEALDAEVTRVFNDKDSGIVYSDPLIDNSTRLEAVKFAATLLDMKPAEKHDVNLKGDVTINLIDKFGGK